jgi:signal transduction histidine kinase
MIISLAVLLGFCSQWVYSQYHREKERLGQDLVTVYGQAERETMDSLLLQNVLHPVLDSSQVPDPVLDKKAGLFILKEIISKAEAEPGPVSGAENISSASREKKITMRMVYNDTLKRRTVRYERPLNSADHVLLSGLHLLIKKIGDTSAGLGFLKSQAADSLLQNRFIALSESQGWDFQTQLVSQRSNDMSSDALTIGSAFSGSNSRFEVRKYQGYLFRQILPQLGFAILVVLLTGAAFLMSWKSIRQQMRLNVIKNDFISNMSHELKTPVATVKVALEAIDRFRVVDDVERTREYLQMAQLEMDRLELLVQQSLHSALMENGRMMFANEPVDVLQLTQKLIRTIQPRVDETSAAIHLEASGNRFTVNADQLHLQGVLMNLLDNALKYGGEAVQIQAAVREKRDVLEIEISDNGPGIQAGYHNAVFDSYFRVPTGNQHNVKGYGLGLSYSRLAVERMNGSIKLENGGSGGCRFIVHFPLI